MRRTVTFPFLSATLVLLACTKKPDAALPADAAAGAASAGPETAAPTAAAQEDAGALAERLLSEAQNRPHIKPNADDVLAAFAKAGAPIAVKKQGLGATFKASFCEGGATGDGWVTVSICEYAGDDAAKTGLGALKAIYPRKLARHVLHKATVLTTMRLQDGAAAEALEARMIEIYSAL